MSPFSRAAAPGLPSTLSTSGLPATVASKLLCVEEVMQMKINGPVSLVFQESSSSSTPSCIKCDYLGYYNIIIDNYDQCDCLGYSEISLYFF